MYHLYVIYTKRGYIIFSLKILFGIKCIKLSITATRRPPFTITYTQVCWTKTLIEALMSVVKFGLKHKNKFN